MRSDDCETAGIDTAVQGCDLRRNYLKKQGWVQLLIRHAGLLKGIVAALTAAAAAALAVSEYEKRHPVYAFYRQDSGGRVKKPVRLVYLTDLHDKEFDRGNAALLSMIEEVSPDAVLIGGDMSTAYMTAGRLKKLKKKPRENRSHVNLALCGALTRRYPVYYGLGNHEARMPEEFMQRLRRTGVRVLDDAAVQFKDINLIGLTLPRKCYTRPKFDRPDADAVAELMNAVDPERYTVMLAHSPNFLNEYAEAGADLVLSGHFHGGTIRIDEHTGLMTPQYQLFNPNCHGRRRKSGTDMIVSAGLGTHTVNVRINDRPEVVVIDIV